MTGNLPEIDKTLQTRFHLPFLYPFQRLVVANVLGEDSNYHHQIVVLPTGAGKSLCFQLPALLLPGITLVVYPLLSLMADQARRLTDRGIPVVILKGGLNRAERNRALSLLADGSARFVITNPETLHQRWCINALRPLPVSHAVVDEAHCVSQWGKTFRPAYLTIGDSLQAIGVERITAFTATAGPTIVEGIKHYLFPEGAHVIQANTDRENIYYRVVPAAVKTRTIAREINRFPRPAIVFCATRYETERVAVDLLERLYPIPVRFYHAGLSRERKAEIESWFFRSEDGVLVATTAYGLGVDKPNVRHVVHHNIPPSPEAYLQESGRAGRDRRPSWATIVYQPDGGPTRPHQDDSAKIDSAGIDSIVNSRVCRRVYLHSAMGLTVDHCTGCDVCDGAVQERDPLAVRVRAFIGRYPGVFTPREIAAIVGSNGRDREDIETYLSALGAAGDLVTRGRQRRVRIAR